MSQKSSLVAIDWKTVPLPSINYNGQRLADAANARLAFKLKPGGIELHPDLKVLIHHLLAEVAAIPSSLGRRKVLLSDAIFGNLFVEQFPPNPKLKSMYWKAILTCVWDWEDKNELVHKGSPYFFMAESFLQSGDIPSAYTCIFSAIEEDKRSSPRIPKSFKASPAYMTASLVENSDNRLHDVVVLPLRAYIENLLNGYNSRSKSKLTMKMLDTKLLQADELEDVKRFFVANFHEAYHLTPINSTRLINNDYSKLKIIDTLFNFGLIVDQILTYRFLGKTASDRRNMAKGFYQFALHRGWTSVMRDKDPGAFLKRLKPRLNDDTPEKVLPDLLDRKGTIDGKALDPQMNAVAAAYHLRNYAGHHLEGSNILVKRYNETFMLVVDALFAAIETL